MSTNHQRPSSSPHSQAQRASSLLAPRSAPRSILKRADHGGAAAAEHKKSHPPKFFTGNEPSLIENIDDELDELKLRPRRIETPIENQQQQQQKSKPSNRFKHSALKQNSTAPASYFLLKKSLRLRRPARTLPAIYILHGDEIKRELIKVLVNATEEFLDAFRNECVVSKTEATSSSDDIFFTSQNKDLFVSMLKSFLMDSDYANYENNNNNGGGSLGLEATLSEPTFAELKQIRKQCRRERTARHKIDAKDFCSTSIDESGNIKSENNFYGTSLPATSFIANQATAAENGHR
jgi:hypothetical protein